MNEKGMDEAEIKSVQDCATSYTGQKLLNELGDETHSLQPALTGVPWVTFNGAGIKYL